MQPLYVDEAQNRSVEKFIEAVIRQAHHQAELAAAILHASGYRPCRRQPNPEHLLPEGHPTRQRAECLLLNLGAAMQISAWERAGLRPELPGDLPTAEEAFQNLLPGDSVNAPVVSELSLKVFRTWLQRFSRSSRGALGTDIVLRGAAVCEDELLEALADLLWNHRQLAVPKEHH